MFTGIVTEVGRIMAVTTVEGGMRLTVEAPLTVSDAKAGDSIAVNGVCLTATSLTESSFECEAVSETMLRTGIGGLVSGAEVNLERPMPASGRFDGHIVQGHVDGVGTVVSVRSEGDSIRLRMNIPGGLARYVVEKGSIAIDGTSLTVTAVSDAKASETWVEVVLIPHTIESTVLGKKKPGDSANLEMDVFAKYIERLTEMN